MKTIIAGALGECVHVAGIANFLRLAEEAGWKTVFLGPAVPIDVFLKETQKVREGALNPGDDLLVGISYRLTPENGERLLGQFAEEAADLHAAGVRFVFGGTPPVAEKAKALTFFERVFDGSQPVEELLAFLKGQTHPPSAETDYPQSTVERIHWKSPYPLLRHHFGLPSMEATLKGIEEIAASKVLDVISLGIDQDAQANFFHPERQDPRQKGAGGVPVRSESDYRALFAASRAGNFPLMRTYSGTDDFIRLAEMYMETIHNAWCAIPLFWFNQMDGRGPWDLEGSIREHQQVISYYGQRGIPVELNEPHHWGMRDAPDVIFVVSAFLSAYNARHFGAKEYISQLMFNSPPGLSDAMDLAKMMAVQKLIEPLRSPDFHIWYQTRTGLLSYPQDVRAARAHLSASIYLQMALKPHIIHVVSQSEADHAATAADVIEACTMAKWVIEAA
ncbi:MAG: methionine synthase, partial [Anaerolineaceae bacterium]|nr:methionine synthase [Anaerolineaceae bacterium]